MSLKHPLLFLLFLCAVSGLHAQSSSFRPEHTSDSTKHRKKYRRSPPVSLLLGTHYTGSTGAEIGLSRSVDYGTAGSRNFSHLTWTCSYSLSVEMHFGKNTLLAPKASFWAAISKIKPVCFGVNVLYVDDLSGKLNAAVVRPEVGIYFRIPRFFDFIPNYILNHRFKLVYGYNFSADPGLTGTHQVSLVFYRRFNAFRGKILK